MDPATAKAESLEEAKGRLEEIRPRPSMSVLAPSDPSADAAEIEIQQTTPGTFRVTGPVTIVIQTCPERAADIEDADDVGRLANPGDGASRTLGDSERSDFDRRRSVLRGLGEEVAQSGTSLTRAIDDVHAEFEDLRDRAAALSYLRSVDVAGSMDRLQSTQSGISDVVPGDSSARSSWSECPCADEDSPEARDRSRRSLRQASIEEEILNDETFLDNIIELMGDPASQPYLPRVVGDNAIDLDADEFPHCVAVGRGGNYYCTGVLISPWLVATAAHCMHDRERRFVRSQVPDRVLFGSDIDEGQEVRVSQVCYVPSNVWGSAGDVAVLKLASKVTGIEPCPLATSAQLQNSRRVYVAGFGHRLVQGANSSSGFGRKRGVELALHPNFCRISPRDCNGDIEFVAMTIEREDRDDTCRGDSGGPCYLRIGSSTVLAGLTNGGTPGSDLICGRGGIYENCTSAKIRRFLTVEAPRKLGVAAPGEN